MSVRGREQRIPPGEKTHRSEASSCCVARWQESPESSGICGGKDVSRERESGHGKERWTGGGLRLRWKGSGEEVERPPAARLGKGEVVGGWRRWRCGRRGREGWDWGGWETRRGWELVYLAMGGALAMAHLCWCAIHINVRKLVMAHRGSGTPLLVKLVMAHHTHGAPLLVIFFSKFFFPILFFNFFLKYFFRKKNVSSGAPLVWCAITNIDISGTPMCGAPLLFSSGAPHT